jgi:hypothetical protein
LAKRSRAAKGVVSDHGVERDDELSHDRDDGDLGLLGGGDQALLERFEDRIGSTGRRPTCRSRFRPPPRRSCPPRRCTKCRRLRARHPRWCGIRCEVPVPPARAACSLPALVGRQGEQAQRAKLAGAHVLPVTRRLECEACFLVALPFFDGRSLFRAAKTLRKADDRASAQGAACGRCATSAASAARQATLANTVSDGV